MQPFNLTNEDIADVLERVAELLEVQDANPYRVRAYRRAARVIERSEQSIAHLADSKEEEKSFLPILHTEREGFHFTALFSNTARAHDLGKTRDWVVVYYDQDGHENQCTVVTEHQGPLRGKRVVRRHERECLAYYSEKGVS